MGVYVCSKGNPIRLTLSSIPNSQLVFIKYTPANKGKGKHSSGSLVSAKKKKKKGKESKKVEPRSRSPTFVSHVALQLCHCACVPRGMDFDTTDYWWNWVHVETSLRGQVNKGGMLSVCLPFQYTSFQAHFCLIYNARMHSRQTDIVYSVSQVQALGKC